jgi:hypothetical protein
VFDPPFRWFEPRSLTEVVMTDEGYEAITRFFREARSHLTAGGRMLIFFGTSGDLGYLEQLMGQQGFAWEPVAHDDLVRDGWKVDYFTFRVNLSLATRDDTGRLSATPCEPAGSPATARARRSPKKRRPTTTVPAHA